MISSILESRGVVNSESKHKHLPTQMVDHSAFEPFNLLGFCRAMGRRAAAGVERGRKEERKCVCVTDKESVKREEMECRCVCVISRPRQSLMALCRDTGAENDLIGRIATMEVCSVPQRKTTAAKTAIIKKNYI